MYHDFVTGLNRFLYLPVQSGSVSKKRGSQRCVQTADIRRTALIDAHVVNNNGNYRFRTEIIRFAAQGNMNVFNVLVAVIYKIAVARIGKFVSNFVFGQFLLIKLIRLAIGQVIFSTWHKTSQMPSAVLTPVETPFSTIPAMR